MIDRIVNRRTCSNCGEIYNLSTKAPRVSNVCDKCGLSDTLGQRKDDNQEVVANRLKIFAETVEPMLAFYKMKGTLVEIDASKQEKEIFTELEKIIS